jgi:hypothetical protein
VKDGNSAKIEEAKQVIRQAFPDRLRITRYA